MRHDGDFRELLARDDIDAVMIATQDHWHALIATAAAAAGKDMYCEKPMGVSIEEGKTMRDAIRKHQRMFQAGTWQRSKSQFRRACELARNGYLGKVHTVEVAAPGPQYQPKYKGSMDPQPVPDGFDWEMWRGPARESSLQPGKGGMAGLVSDLGLLRGLHLQLGRASPGHCQLGLPADRFHRLRSRGLRRSTGTRVSPTTSTAGTSPSASRTA